MRDALAIPRLLFLYLSEVSNPSLVISQIYTRGGEAGATYNGHFVEVFNAGNSVAPGLGRDGNDVS